jgi:hypothetical protein
MYQKCCAGALGPTGLWKELWTWGVIKGHEEEQEVEFEESEMNLNNE